MINKIFIVEGEKSKDGTILTWISSKPYEAKQEAEADMIKRKSKKCRYSVVEFARVIGCLITLTTLTGCVSMPVTTLRDDKGHTIACGGETSSVLPVAYVIDKGVDEACIARAKSKGFQVQ